MPSTPEPLSKPRPAHDCGDAGVFGALGTYRPTAAREAPTGCRTARSHVRTHDAAAQPLRVADRVVPRVRITHPAVAEPRRATQRQPRTHRRRRIGTGARRMRFDHHLRHLVVLAVPRHPAALATAPVVPGSSRRAACLGWRSPAPSARTPRASIRCLPPVPRGPARCRRRSPPASPLRELVGRGRRRPRWRTAAGSSPRPSHR